VVEDALVAGEAERLEDCCTCGFAVGGDDADGVAGGVGHALFEGELDVDGLFFGFGAGEPVIRDQHL
jgi:hypothetical protein